MKRGKKLYRGSSAIADKISGNDASGRILNITLGCFGLSPSTHGKSESGNMS